MIKVVFVVNKASYFISHRLPIGIALVEKGFEVHVVAPDDCSSELVKAGFIYHQVAMSRKGKNPWNELIVIWSLVKLFKKIKPNLVHLVSIKSYLYGGIAARIAGISSVVSAVAGLGILFSQNSLKNKLLRRTLLPIFNCAFKHKNQVVIFQNSNDRDLLVNLGALDKDKATLVRGAGVSLEQYPFYDEPIGIPVVSFAARLLFDKGVSEFIEAAKILKNRGVEVEFRLIGDSDFGNKNSVPLAKIREWKGDGLVKCYGYRSDIAPLFSQSNIIAFPSYYGEGLPKVLIEAAACGRAVITTDHPGCRDAIDPYETGLLVPIKDATALADSIKYLIDNPDERKAMGNKGRILAEKEFRIEKIVDEHIHIYRNLLDKVGL